MMKECPNCIVAVEDNYDVCWNCSYNFTSKKMEGFKTNDIDIKSDKPEPRKLDCLRCKSAMIFQEASSSQMNHLLSNRNSYDEYICPNCKKVEFFLSLSH